MTAIAATTVTTETLTASTSISIGGFTITAKGDGLYVSGGGVSTKIQLLLLGEVPVPPESQETLTADDGTA
jgi:hypothetical protein